MDNQSVYQEWTEQDMIIFNGYLIDEKEVPCKWMDHGTPCDELVQAKNLKDHLHHRHGVMSNSQSYHCHWDACHHKEPMQKTSLERHVVEQHVPVKWACPYPYCVETFTREHTLRAHIARSHA
ncbi:hypothetical protein OG21DRAFT_1517947 [Imleria badia]|nr:hypothetical protein OG21DRAFT_1517947 [Imleria badia]